MSFYITTSISYVNGQPHLGHAYEAIATDVLARHHRQRSDDTFFLTGTDEHGEPVADAAKANGYEPREWADLNAEKFKALLPELGVEPDFFIRTSDPQHEQKVQDVLQRVYDNGYVYKGTYTGWYCPRCADFKVENEILEGNRCPIHEIELTKENEENYFFKLSAFQSQLEALFAENQGFVGPPRARNEAEAFLAGGLQDVSLTRAKLTWGVQVPWDHSHVFYVWFDALLNYYTALSYARANADLTERYWPASVHMIGKDILKFHTIYWPALLLAAGLEPPKGVFVHGFLQGADGRKMSKSLGNGLDPLDVTERFGADALRFFLLREVQFGSDGPVGMDAVANRYSAELANDYGNLASRTLAMIARYRDSDVSSRATDPELAAEFTGLPATVSAALDAVDLTGGLDQIWQRVRRLNRYVEEQRPWELARDEAAAARLDTVLASLHEGVRSLSVLLYPFIPAATAKVLAALGTPDTDYSAAAFGTHAAATARVEKIPPLFPKEPD
ncbi:MAG: methionine--tRNA ligase [Solirubrobacterales bacterium]|nr:methionine--tRNA ligase [Solirubrobacterales bacterium]